MSDESKNIAHYIIADGRQKDVQSYVERGRKFQGVTDEYLREHFVAEMKKWASTPPPWDPIDRLNDIESECTLRQIDPPYEMVEEYLNAIAEMVKARMAEQPSDEDDGYLKERLIEYYKAQATKS